MEDTGTKKTESEETPEQGFEFWNELYDRGPAPNLFEGVVDRGVSLSKRLFDTDKADVPMQNPREERGTGRIERPFDFEAAELLPDINPYHSSCIATLVAATCGEGIGVIDEERYRKQLKAQAALSPEEAAMQDPVSTLPPLDEEKTLELYDRLDGLCEHGFDATIRQCVEQFYNLGTGFLEVSRDRSSTSDEIYGLHWRDLIPTYRHQVGPKRSDYAWFDEGQSFNNALTTDPSVLPFAKFGELERTLRMDYTMIPDRADETEWGEIIDIMQITSRWEGYGRPRYMGAVGYIEVDRNMLQRVSDYMWNGGVPDTLLLLGGFAIDPRKRVEFERKFRPEAGSGRKSGGSVFLFAQNATKDRAMAEVLKIGSEIAGDSFKALHETVNLCIASAHGVLPNLAGITSPGKLGAANEVVQQLVMLQCSSVSPEQRYIANRLNRTLFGKSGFRDLQGTKIRFRTWLEAIDMPALNQVARQRQREQSPAETKNREAGLKD